MNFIQVKDVSTNLPIIINLDQVCTIQDYNCPSGQSYRDIVMSNGENYTVDYIDFECNYLYNPTE